MQQEEIESAKDGSEQLKAKKSPQSFVGEESEQLRNAKNEDGSPLNDAEAPTAPGTPNNDDDGVEPAASEKPENGKDSQNHEEEKRASE